MYIARSSSSWTEQQCAVWRSFEDVSRRLSEWPDCSTRCGSTLYIVFSHITHVYGICTYIRCKKYILLYHLTWFHTMY